MNTGHLDSFYLQDGATHTPTHTKKNWTPSGLYSVEPGRGTFPPRAVWSSLSGCGTRTRRQQCSTKRQGPGTTPRMPTSTGTDQTRRQQARRGFFSFSSFFATGRTFFPRRLATSSYPSPPPRVEGKRSEVLASGLDEGLSGDSWPPLIGRAHGGRREPHPCT